MNENEIKVDVRGIAIEKTIEFIRLRWFAFVLSVCIVGFGVFLFYNRGGFELGVDFKGGVKIETHIENSDVTIHDIRKLFDGYDAEINIVGAREDKNFLVTLPVTDVDAMEEINTATDILKQKYGEENIEIRGSEAIEAKMGQDFSVRAIQLILITCGLILVYIIIRFDLFYGIGAILALIHDVCIMLAFCLFFGVSIDITVIAGFLTIIGYSINDTIVVFDRIREIHQLNKDEDYEYVIDKSITQTLSRTIITALTTLFVAIAIFVWGGIVLHSFAFILIIGIVSGTYSSIFIASPITYMLKTGFDKKLKKA